MPKVTTVVGLAALLLPSLASAQFGMLNLPRDDFTWRWADAADTVDPDQGLGAEDFDVRGGEMSFQCVLTGALSPGSRITMQELQQMESDLVASLFFIQASATMMNELDINREIAWAILDCKNPQGRDEDPEELEEKVDRARQKAVEDMLKRRERAEGQQ